MDDFARLYPDNSNLDLAALFAVSIHTVVAWAGKLGLRKSQRYRRGVQRANASRRRLTAAQRQHMSEIARGRRPSAESIRKAIETKTRRGTILRGNRHPNWKGGRPWRRFRDPRYLRWRNAVLDRDRYRCRACGRLCRKYEKGLAAHHLASYSAWPDLRFDITNGITLCRSCHMAIHQRPIEPPSLISCACGCGTQIPNRDVYGRARRYVNFHGARGKPKSEAAKAKLRAKRVGRALTPEHRAKISMGLRSSAKRIGRPPNRS